MQLHLQQPIPYTQRAPFSDSSCVQAFDHMLNLFDNLPVGSDGCLLCEAIMTDDVCIVNHIGSVYSALHENLEVLQTIPAGTYLFHQLQFPPANGATMVQLLNRFANALPYGEGRTSRLFVRVYKERQFEMAIQFMAPVSPAQ